MTGRAPGKVLAITAVNLRRFVRDRTNLFFVFVFPIAIVLMIGAQFGDDRARLGVVGDGGEIGRSLVDALGAEEDVVVVTVDDRSELTDRVGATELDAGLILPGDLDRLIGAGGPATIALLTANTPAGQQLATSADRELARILAVPTAVRAATDLGADRQAAGAVAEERAAPVLDRIGVQTVTTGDRLFPEGTAGFDVAAPSQLVLFTFLVGLSGSSALIQTRQLGVSTRMMATPTSVRTILGGEAAGRFVIGLVQGLYILLAALLLFGIDWGDPVGAAAVLMAIAAVSAGAAMLFGTVFANAEQASGIGVVVALAIAAVGGAMMPIELFGEPLATIARATPHFWALDAFAELVRHDASVLDVLPQVGVLFAYAAALLLVASWRMRIVLSRPAG